MNRPLAIQPIQHQAAWNSAGIVGIKRQWIHYVSPAQLEELEHALAMLRQSGKPILDILPSEFPIPSFSRTLHRASISCERGPGIYLIRGLPVDRKSEHEVRLLAWGIGLHLGVPLMQDPAANLITDIRDQSANNASSLRIGSTNQAMEFHVDSCDLATVLCRRTALTGGLSRIASTMAIHNRLALERSQWLPLLYQPMPFIVPASQPKCQPAHFMCPVFAVENNVFASRFYRQRTLACVDLPDTPRQSKQLNAALDAFHDLACAPEMYLEIDLQPGDLLLMNNHVVCHARTAFIDDPRADYKRHLLRQWLATPHSRPLPSSFLAAYGRVDGATIRGGYQTWHPHPHVLAFQARLGRYLGMPG